MALTSAHRTKHDIPLSSAYISIVSLQMFKQSVQEENGGAAINQHTIRIYANVYADKQAFIDGRPEVENIERVYPMDTEKPAHKQAYKMLKDEFGGIDTQ